MIHQIFSVYDSKAEAFLPPFFMSSKGMALRAFADILSDPNHAFSKHSGDYTLFHLGCFDDENAYFDMLNTPHSLGLAVELKQ